MWIDKHTACAPMYRMLDEVRSDGLSGTLASLIGILTTVVSCYRDHVV